MARKVHQSEVAPSTEPTESAFARRARRVVAGGAAGVLALTLAACGTKEASSTPSAEETHSETASTAPATPGETESGKPTVATGEVPKPSEVITDATAHPESYVTNGIFEYLDPQTQDTINALNGMDTLTFRRQPQEQQTAFADYVVYNASPYMDSWLKKAGINLTYTRNPQNAQQIEDNAMYVLTLATHLVEKRPVDGGWENFLDNQLAYKLAAASNLSTEGQDMRIWDGAVGIDISQMWNPAGLDTQIGTVTSETKNPDGSITYTASNKAGDTSNSTAVPVTVTSLTGDGAQFTLYLSN